MSEKYSNAVRGSRLLNSAKTFMIASSVGTASIKTPLGGARSNDLVLGFDVNYIKLRYDNNFAFATYTDQVDPFTFDPGILQNRAETLPRYRTRTGEWAIFGEDRLKLTEKLSVIGGFRYEEDRVKRRNYVYTNGQISGTANAFPGGVRLVWWSGLCAAQQQWKSTGGGPRRR